MYWGSIRGKHKGEVEEKRGTKLWSQDSLLKRRF
jgi:hypothetical protein